MAEKATRTLLKDKNGNKLLPITTWGSITGDIANQTDLNGILSTNNTMTNCITKIPQNVKIETSGNTVTIKAGSILKMPTAHSERANPEVFLTEYLEFVEVVQNDYTDYYIYKTKEDISLTIENGSGKDFYICLEWSGWKEVITAQLKALDKSECKTVLLSEVTDPVASLYTNYPILVLDDGVQNPGVNFLYPICKMGEINSETGESSGTEILYSLPLALVTNDGTNCTKVEAFNGLWYFDTTIGIDKGLKILISDGLNDDGTYKNEEYTFDNYYISLKLGTGTTLCKLVINKPGQVFNDFPLPIITRASVYYESEDIQPGETLDTAGQKFWRNPKNNKNYFVRGMSNIMDWTEFKGVITNVDISFGYGESSSYRINEFSTPAVFQTYDKWQLGNIIKYDAATKTLEINT